MLIAMLHVVTGQPRDTLMLIADLPTQNASDGAGIRLSHYLGNFLLTIDILLDRNANTASNFH